MSDVPQRPRIRPATSDDWQKDRTDSAGLSPSQASEAERSPADFDRSTYYEYLERRTGEHSVSKTHSGNPFAPAGASPFDEHARAASGPRSGAAQSGSPHPGVGPATGTPATPLPVGGPGTANSAAPPQFPPAGAPPQGPRRGNGLKITAAVIAMTMILALVAFFGIRWLAPSSGTVPVDVGADEASAPPSPSETLVQPSQGPEQQLDALTRNGTEKAADLEGQWVTQISAKNVGLEADGRTWTAQDILNEFQANQVRYPGSILIHSSDWASYKDGSYWVTVIDTPYSEPEGALDQCRSWGLDRDHCLAKRLVKDGSPQDNSAYLDD